MEKKAGKGGDQPTPKQAEGIRQLIMMVKQMQDTVKKTNPEKYAQMMAKAKGQRG